VDCPRDYINKGVDLKAAEKSCEFDGTKTFTMHSWAIKHWCDKHAVAAYKAWTKHVSYMPNDHF
jgi:hypothetical protein